MNDSFLDSLYANYLELISKLEQEEEISMLSMVNNSLKKNFLLSVASYYEHTIVENLSSYFDEKSQDAICLKEFLINKGLKRQYHTLFSWEQQNANTFFSLFGSNFKDFMSKKTKEDKKLETSIKSFLEIGRERNRLVHQNFGLYTADKTLEEVYNLYENANFFVSEIISFLEEFHNQR